MQIQTKTNRKKEQAIIEYKKLVVRAKEIEKLFEEAGTPLCIEISHYVPVPGIPPTADNLH